MNITEFLLARIAEDEAEARKYQEYEDQISETAGWFEPSRVLAECAAKRAIIDAHRRQDEDDDPDAWIVASEVLLKSLAAVYKDHPDYQEAWAVGG